MPHKLAFKVTHASGQDDVCRASELNYHSPLTKGWQAARFCLYPQEIVINFERRSRIKKIQVLSHQTLIATKIEFFVGDVPDGLPVVLENARYTRLGYVSLSDNEKTGFKARELKSVQVDAVGVFLKLNIHKNHINKYNLYNQVGLVAVNVIGDEVRRPLDEIDDLDIYGERRKAVENDPALEGLFTRPDYISPLDDLAFDMYQDPEIAQIIRKLERKKQEAVLQERYDYAKKLKHAIQELQKVGEKLGKYEVEKRQAIENEDYDKAKLKKVQMDEYRLQIYKDIDVQDLLELSGSRHPQKIDLEQVRQPTPPRLLEIPPRTPPSPSPRTPYDERPLPAIKSQQNQSPNHPRTPYDERPLPIHNKDTAQIEPGTPPPKTPYDERVIPVAKNNKTSVQLEDELEPPPDTSSGITGDPEPMTEKDLREASTAIDVFGEQLVQKAYSKTWSYREDALLAVYKQMKELPPGTSKEEAKSMLRASTFLIKRAIDDKVYAVFKAGLMLLKMILTEFCPSHKIPRADTSYCVERTLPNLLHKSGDTALRNRDDAKNFVYEMAQFHEVKPMMVVSHECVKPWKSNIAPRLAQSRAEIVETLYEQLGIKDPKSGLTTDNIMTFCVVALNHNSADVRQVAERIIKALYKEVGSPVKEYLPPDDEKTRKNTMWRLLFEYFDKVDGKPSKSDVKRQKAEEETRKQREIEGLQKQLQQLKDMASGKAPVDEAVLDRDVKKPPATKKPKPKLNTKPAPKPEDDDASILNMENICIFCGERNSSFTEEGLDLHYWKNCPMLKRCANCKQVVEIASYTDHLLTECEAKANYGKCPRCTEAIPKSELDAHVAEKACNSAKSGLNHCPLCHQNIPSGEDGWKNHLMGKDGCKQNPRRLLALNKQPPQGGKSTGGVPTARGKQTKGLVKKTPR